MLKHLFKNIFKYDIQCNTCVLSPWCTDTKVNEEAPTPLEMHDQVGSLHSHLILMQLSETLLL